MKFEILGVPERFANAPGEVTPESSRAPLRNPDVAPPLSPMTPSEDAHAALLALAQQDGWTALYDPTNPDMVTLDGTGNAIGLKDSLGLYPDASALVPTALSDAGALKASSSVWLATGAANSARTVIGLVKVLSPSYATPFTHSTSAGSIANMSGLTATFAGEWRAHASLDPGYFRLDSLMGGPEWVVFEFNTSTGETRLGGQRVVPDEDLAGSRNSSGSSFIFGADLSGAGNTEAGPLLIMEGEIDDQTRSNAVDMLTKLSGAPVANRIGQNTAEAYCTMRPNGELVEAFRPDRPVQLASLTKVLVTFLARKVVTNAMLDNLIDCTSQYVVEPTNRTPVVYPGDKLSWRTAFHLSLMVSHNQITDVIAYNASRILFGPAPGASLTNPSPQIDLFVDHMNDYVQSQGWAEGVFTTPQGRGDSILTPRHMSELMHQVNVQDPWVQGVMDTLSYQWSVLRINPVEDQPNPEIGTTTNIVRVNSGGQDLIELAGGKTGDTPAPTIRTVSVFWDDPVTGERLVTSCLNTGIVSADRYLLLRQLFDAQKTRYGAPDSWSASDERTGVEWRNEVGDSYAAAFISPGSTGARLEVMPFSRFNDPLPIVQSGNTISAGMKIRSGNAPNGATMVMELEIVGGYFTDGSSAKRWSIGATTSWVNFTGSGVVKRGGVLKLRAFIQDGNSKTLLWVKDASLSITTPERTTYPYVMDVSDFQLTQDSQPLNPADSGGGVGDYSVSVKIPEFGETVFSEYGSRYLQGKRSRLTTTHGVANGTITDVSDTDLSLLQVQCQTELGALNAYDITAPPYTGDLGGLITEYFALIAESAPEFTIDPELGALPITAPSWEGELWFHLKQLCMAYDMQLSFKQEGGVHFGKTPGNDMAALDVSGVTTTNDAQRRARAVEVVKYTTERRENTLLYPPGGWDDGAEVITVGPGETVTHTLELEASVESWDVPQYDSYVAKDTAERSVFTIVDENGATVPLGTFRARGGAISFTLNPDRQSFTVKITAPGTYLRDDGRSRITSYSIGSRFGDAGTQYSTLRIVGTGVHITPETVKINTGLSDRETGTEVGATLDNIFVTTWSQVRRLGARMAAAYAGFSPKISYDVPTTPGGWGDSGAGALLKGSRMDYRHRSSTYTPGGVSVTADYATAHQRFEDSVAGMTYADVDAWTDGLSYGDTASRGLKQ